ncbi:MAG: hypothetical protein JST35_01530 [Armatimonadetes bacterium]|nr:hypothetical protein [Armatimonadota bacterium]
MENKTLAQKLQSVPRTTLFAILVLFTAGPLFISGIKIPGEPTPEVKSLFNKLMTIPEGSTVLIGSDWTKSTRGESQGAFRALVRILMRRKIKFAIYTTGDPQAPEVARNEVKDIIDEEKKADPSFKWERWNDWVSMGYFPGAEGTANAFENDFVGAVSDKKDVTPQGLKLSVTSSPVLEKIKSLEDVELIVTVTASKTVTIAIERIKKAPMAAMVTGVMGPETRVYYPRQLMGMSAGLRGVYDMESMMEKEFTDPKYKDLNKDRGARYYPTLHFAIGLLIIAVIIGNVGMFMQKKEEAKS